MELQKQCVSLDLAKKMKELGFEQESIWYWITGRKTEFDDKRNSGKLYLYSNETFGKEKHNEYLKGGFGIFSAYTVAELGEMIEGNCFSYKDDDGDWTCQYSEVRGLEDDLSNNEKADTEANARAKCLIFLVENGIIKI